MTAKTCNVPGCALHRNPCCEPTTPPSDAAYKRHRYAGTIPCDQALADSSVHRANRPRSAR